MKDLQKKFKDIFFLGVLLVLALWLSPFILIGVFLYLGYRLRKTVLKKKVLEQVRRDWWPRGKYVLFLYADSKKWKDYFEEQLLPKIRDRAIICNWSTRHKNGWDQSTLEAKILRLWGPLGYFYPLAIVFLPSGEVKTFQFYAPYIKMLKSGGEEYKNLEKEFLDLVSSIT